MENIRTDRLILRKLQYSDKEELFSIFNNNKVKEYVSGLYCETLEELDYLLEYSFDYINKFAFIVEDCVSKKIVGFIYSYIFIDYIAHTSYITKVEERGKGYIPEALKAFISYMYEKKLAASIHFTIKKDNNSSIKVMEKLKIPSNFQTENFNHYDLSLCKKPSF